jgi:ribonuclease PH
VDFNVALTGSGRFVEVQGSAENGGSFDRSKLLEMIDLGAAGCRQLMEQIRQAVRAGA